MKKRTVLLIVVLAAVLGLTALLPILSISKYSGNAKTFSEDGYILVANTSGSSEAVNTQYYFNGGEKYRESYDDKVTFEDINGTKVSAEKENFLHYNSGSLNALTTSVLLDTDNMKGDQVAYYSINSTTTLNKSNSSYTVNNAGENLSFSNFIWKVSDTLYMAVSEEIKLMVNSQEELTFSGYVEVQYIDEGVVHLVNQSGTYSTISSDAYLELSNGIRIYVGSKNVSDSEGILMNMTQMVVNSDDNIEVIPDKEYVNEDKTVSEIIVNATDGSDGESGESGDAGQAGDNGKNGSKGSPGNKGNSITETGEKGKSAENADIVYTQEAMPVFSNVQITPSAYGADYYMEYNDNTCTVHNAWLSVIEDSTGIEIWRYSITSLLTKKMTLENICNVLTQSTTYNLVIGCTYTSDTQATPVSQNVYSQKFITDSLGVDISKLYCTSGKIVLKLSKSQSTDIKNVKVAYYDAQMKTLGYGYLGGEDEDSGTTIFNIEEIEVGGYYEVVFDELEPNSVYYMQIEVQEMRMVGDEQISVTVLPSNSFTKQKYSTLKRDPSISQPTIDINEETSSFIVTPGLISDIDNGITSYIYELYSVEGYGDDAEPVYSVEKTTANPLSIPIDGTKVKREQKYFAKIKTKFFNNYDEMIYESPLSDIICANSSVWPSIDLSYEEIRLMPSAIEGNVLISDDNGTLGAASYITLTYKTMLPESTGLSETERNISREIRTTFKITDFAKSEEGVYVIPIAIKGLKSNQSYTVAATSSKITTDSGEYANALIGTTTFHTPEYTKMNASLVNLNDSNQKISYALNFSATNPLVQQMLAETEYENSQIGLDSLEDFNGKSATYVKVELFKSYSILENDVPVYYPQYDAKLGEFTAKDDDAITDPGEYAAMYSYNSSIYRSSFKDSVNELTAAESEMLQADKQITSVNVGENAVLYLSWATGIAFPDNLSEILPEGVENKRVSIEKYDTYFKLSFKMPDYPLEIKMNDGSEEIDRIVIGRKNKGETGSLPQGYALIASYLDEYKPIIINDEAFATDFSNPLSEVEAGQVLFVRISVYDYTYGRSSNYNVNGKSNEIPLKTNTIMIMAKAKLPDKINDSDYCKEACLLTKYTASLNLYSNENYYNKSTTAFPTAHPNNLNNGKDEPSGAYKDYLYDTWDDNGDLTYVGVAYRGPQLLANYCSDDKSVRYIVYADKERKIKIADSDWLVYNYNAVSNNRMPEWTFFTDVTDKNSGASVERGETFYIETQIRMKHYGDKVYPNEFLGILGDDFVVMEEYVIDKETPVIKMIPYDCDASVVNGVRSSDLLYYTVSDPDMALDYENEKTFKVNAGTSKTLYLEWDNRYDAPDAVEEVGSSVTTIEAKNGYYELNISMPSSGKVTYKVKKGSEVLATITIASDNSGTTSNKHYYTSSSLRKVKFYDTVTDNDYVSGSYGLNADGFYELNCSLDANKPVKAQYQLNEKADKKEIALCTEKGLMYKAGVTMIEKPADYEDPNTDNPIPASGIWDEMSSDERTINIHFLYTTHNPYDNLTKAELLCASVQFTNKVTGKSKTLSFIYPVPDETHDFTLNAGGQKYYFYQANLSIKVTDIAEIIDGNDIEYKVSCYYDSSKYGYKYLNESTGSPYFLVEKTKDEGVGYYSDSLIAEYPDLCYTMSNIPSGIGDATLESYVHIKKGAPIPVNNVLTFENTDYTIQSYGLEGVVIKNTGISARTNDTVNLRYALPMYEETRKMVGFSTFNMAFTITAGHTLLNQNDGKTLKIYYQRQKKEGETTSYPWQNVDVTFADGQVKFEKVVSNLEPDTTYKYYVAAYVKDGDSIKEVQLSNSVNEFTTISKYLHQKRDRLDLRAEKTGRDDKFLDYTCYIDDVVTEDMSRALTNITFELLDRNGTVLKSDTLPITDLIDYFTLHSDSQYLGDIEYIHTFNFAPAALSGSETYGKHQLDDDEFGAKYSVRVTYTYNAQYSATDTPQTNNYNLKAFQESVVSFSMVPKSGIEVDTNNNTLNFYLEYYITGADTKRIIPVVNSNNIYLIVELVSIDAMGNEEVVCINNQYQRMIVTGTVSNNGWISTGSTWFRFNNLEPGTAHKVKIYTIADKQNVKVNTFNLASISSTLTTQENPDILDPDKFEERHIMVKQSAIKYTDSSTSVVADSLALFPTTPTQHIVVGRNLEKVKMIVYTYRQGTDETVTVTYNSTEITSKFRSVTSQLYYLSMPEINSSSSSYSVRVDFYESENQAEPSSSIETSYGTQEE